MIRINLVGEAKKPVTAGSAALSSLREGIDRSLLILGALLLAGLLVSGGHFLILNSALKAKTAEVAEAQREVDELAPFIKEVEDFKAKKVELERKVKVISQLKANQRGPVRLMDHVSRAVPPLLWLTRMEVSPNRVTISGEAFNTNAVANFIENLDRVPEFQEPILKDTSQRGQIYNYVVEFGYTWVEPEEGAAGEIEAAGP